MNEEYLRPRRILDRFSPLYPEAWRQVDDLRARRKELGDWPDWCFLPLAGAYAIVSGGKRLGADAPVEHVGILGALAAWRVTQGIYRFDSAIFDALWGTPVTGDIPTGSCSTCPNGAATSRPLTGAGVVIHFTDSSRTSNTTPTTGERSCGSFSMSQSRKATIWSSCPCISGKAGSPKAWRR
jgi:hypothetical protein